jgi:hypothetical protein
MNEAIFAAGHAPSVRERQLASACDLTVITESPPSVHSGGLLAEAIRRSFGTEARTYDLLSVPNLKLMLKDAGACAMLAEDVRTAVSLHRMERILVASVTVPPRQVIQRLKDQEALRGAKNLRFKGFTIQRPRAFRADEYRTLVVTCMDFRLQGPEGIGAFYDLVGRVPFGLAATPGAAKDLAHPSTRRRVIAGQLAIAGGRGLKRVVLVSHEDCGKYGGRDAFASDANQRNTLAKDLLGGARWINECFPALEVTRAIARCDKRRILGIDVLPGDDSPVNGKR